MKKNLSIHELVELADNIMLSLSNSELNQLQTEFRIVLQRIDQLLKIDTTGISAMHYPFDIETDFLRGDDNYSIMSQSEALSNAPAVQDGYIVINRVVE